MNLSKSQEALYYLERSRTKQRASPRMCPTSVTWRRSNRPRSAFPASLGPPEARPAYRIRGLYHERTRVMIWCSLAVVGSMAAYWGFAVSRRRGGCRGWPDRSHITPEGASAYLGRRSGAKVGVQNGTTSCGPSFIRRIILSWHVHSLTSSLKPT